MAALTSPQGRRWEHFAQTTLSQLKAQFFSSLEDENEETLSQFYSSFCAFRDTLDSIHAHLSSQTHAAIAEFTGMMSIVSSSLLESGSPDIVDQLKTNLLSDLLQVPPPTQNATRISQAASPWYIEPSVRWLRTNIHNPYPPRAVRACIAGASRSAIKDIDAWFIDARKRIGWSRMRHSRFSNRKGDMVDAATRFFTNSDPLRPLDSIIESEFAAILSTVEEMYQEKCASSALAAHLDDAVRDLTPELQISLSKQRRQASDIREPKAHRRLRPYPTPELSPTLSSSSVAAPEPPPLTLPVPIVSGGRKRRPRSTSIGCPTDVEEERSRPTKRIRHSSPQSLRDSAASCYPSPTSSIVLDLAEQSAELPVSADVKIIQTGEHKRTPQNAAPVCATPSPEPSGLPTSSTPLSLSPNDVLAQATHSSPSNPLAISETAACDSFGPPDPFFPAFMHGNPPIGKCWIALAPHPSLTARSGGLSLSFPLFFNIVDDTVPTDVLVDFDPSWANCSTDGLATSSVDTSITGYDMNFDNFGTGMYGGAMNSFSDSLWSGTPQLQPLASTSQSGSGMSTLTSQLNVSPPSSTGVYDVASPSSPSPVKFPSALLTDKARELMELEARCAALRSELAGAC
uniref:Mating-type homeodomain protein n=1 Tax=Coprinellus disseminatus TaxID=71703 RepID=Q1WMS3_COPDI|nr:mating-type homeodomain protein [Coprinellus disseminatus]